MEEGNSSMHKRKFEGEAIEVAKTKKSSFSPWWDHRKQQLSEWLTFGGGLKSHKKIAWIKKSETQSSSPDISIHSQFQKTSRNLRRMNFYGLSKFESNQQKNRKKNSIGYLE